MVTASHVVTTDNPRASTVHKHSLSMVLSMKKTTNLMKQNSDLLLFSWELVCLARSQLTLSDLAQAVTSTCVSSKGGVEARSTPWQRI